MSSRINISDFDDLANFHIEAEIKVRQWKIKLFKAALAEEMA